MSTRIYRRHLPSGWYPSTEQAINQQISLWGSGRRNTDAVSCIVPHAGWYYSGEITFRVFSSCSNKPKTIVLAGGHLHPNSSAVLLPYDEYQCPQGTIKANLKLESYLMNLHAFETTDTIDNSIEVQLPLIKHCFPDSQILCLRLPPSKMALDIANSLNAFSVSEKTEMIVIGSTDLTHYGPNYMFTKDMNTEEAVLWVKEKNDKKFIDSCLNYKEDDILEYGINNRAACSAGAALLAVEYAKLQNATKTELVAYSTSYDKQPSDSFVGYAGIIYS